MDSHRVEVLHVADGDAGVAEVAHDLVLDLLPAREVLLDQHLEQRLRTRINRIFHQLQGFL